MEFCFYDIQCYYIRDGKENWGEFRLYCLHLRLSNHTFRQSDLVFRSDASRNPLLSRLYCRYFMKDPLLLFSVKILSLKLWANCVQLFSKHQTTFRYCNNKKRKEGKKRSATPNIKDPVGLFKDTRHLLLGSYKHAASQRQMESRILTEAACCAKKYQCEETCSISSTLTQITKHAGQTPPDGKLGTVWLCWSLLGWIWSPIRYLLPSSEAMCATLNSTEWLWQLSSITWHQYGDWLLWHTAKSHLSHF